MIYFLFPDIFKINPITGEISTTRSLRPTAETGSFIGTYNLTVEATDFGNPSLKSSASVIINVVKINNGPPVWVKPGPNETVTILEVGHTLGIM